ncbi:MAG: GNAT family N-acetyltransferase [Nocardioidaceae bacterium]|nr:GNAT family N-acetyltransferase [Nocardioidaceae bacterium]
MPQRHSTGRGAVQIRDAAAGDAPGLQSIWMDFTAGYRPVQKTASIEQIERAIRRLETEPAERLLVATLNDGPVGVAHLRRAPMSPIQDEDAVHVGYLHVLSQYRRRGVGKQLLDAAADWADEKDSRHVVASIAATARDANRFLARLGFGQVAVVRACSVATLRSKLEPAVAKSASTNLVAARRLKRRARTMLEGASGTGGT